MAEPARCLGAIKASEHHICGYPFAQLMNQCVLGPDCHHVIRCNDRIIMITAMLENPMAQDLGLTEIERLQRVWHDDMIWWGPGGIGATYTIPRYLKQHSEPFNDGLRAGYKYNGHLCRMAEGNFGGFFGWANLTVTNAGGYLGMTKAPGPADMRVVDLYRIQDGKLTENWIFIDMLHYLAMQGLDVLDRMARIRGY